MYIVPSLGGREQKIGTIYPTGKIPVLSWSTDNRFIYFSQWSPQDSSVAVFKVSLETRDVVKITSPPAEIVGDISPNISPDGKYLGFIRWGMEGNQEIYIQNLATTKVHQVTNEHVRIQGFTWGPNNRSILYSANLDGTSALWKTDLSGKRREKILSGVNVNHPDYSPTGNCIVYNERAGKSSIWKMDLRFPENEILLITSSTSGNRNPAISPDGHKILFSSDRTGTDNIWLCNSDGTEPTQLTFFDKQDKSGTALWSPQGDEILISFGGREFHILSLSTGQMIDFTSLGADPLWAENGRDFYASSYPEINLYFLSRDGTIKKRLTTDRGLYAKLSGDYLYYFKHYDQREIWRVSIDGTHEEPVLQGVDGLGIRTWDVVSNGLYYFCDINDSPALCFYDFDTRSVKEIKTGVNAFGSIDVDPTEQYLLYSKSESNYSDIILVENFR
jgi:Tol biopolymer transport system component